jgi:predicted metal-dependent peptidase
MNAPKILSSSISDAELAEANKLLSKGRLVASNRAPYISTTLYALVPRFVRGRGDVKTMAVSRGMVLYINIDWFLTEPCFKTGLPTSKHTKAEDREREGLEVVGACLMHEVEHVQRDLRRLEVLEHKKIANAAADKVINDQLIRAGWKLPPWVERLEQFKFPENKTLEWYYAELLKMREEIEEKELLVGPCCGGMVGNSPDKELEDELDAEVGRLPIEVENIVYNTNKKILEHIKSHGNVTGYDVSDLEFKPQEPLVPWPRVLQYTLRRSTGRAVAGEDDSSYARMNRRGLGLQIIRPGHVRYTPNIFFFRDTSGSMSDEDLNTCNNEVIGCMQACSIEEVTICDVDVQMHGKPRVVRIADIPKMQALGRGGTAFELALKYIEDLRVKPDVVVYLTDGYGSAPKQAPRGYNVIWCLVPSSGNCIRPVPWGDFVVCSDDRALRDKLAQQFGEEGEEDDEDD